MESAAMERHSCLEGIDGASWALGARHQAYLGTGVAVGMVVDVVAEDDLWTRAEDVESRF